MAPAALLEGATVHPLQSRPLMQSPHSRQSPQSMPLRQSPLQAEHPLEGGCAGCCGGGGGKFCCGYG